MSIYPTWINPISLHGKHVSLEPLQVAHADALREAVEDGQAWKLWYTSAPAPGEVENYIATALTGQGNGTDLPFTLRDSDGRVVGSTRYCHVEAANRRLEIGYTWLAARVQRSAVNTEAKLLLLGHAFDALGAIAVEFRTHWFNFRSRAAIARLGARQDGVLRNAARMPDGGFRDTVVFSIIASEWPAVKQHLRYELDKHRQPT